MEIQSAFVTGAFDQTEEIWKKAIEYLGIENTNGRTHIKRMGTNQIQIFQYEEVDEKSIFESSANHKTKVIASFTGRAIGNKKKWVRLKT
tara:strand:+ start:36 stop:305 length:270 start_codon:yes stop_codon:yes gene_type:complete